jgi:transposase InsO family protein
MGRTVWLWSKWIGSWNSARFPQAEVSETPNDRAMTEAINAPYKSELIRARGRRRRVEQVELATRKWVWWTINQRRHSGLGCRTPIEVEQARYTDSL